MQKSSSGSGEQEPAPISQAEKPSSATKPEPSNSTSAAGQTNTNPATASGASGASAGSRQPPSGGDKASVESDEAAQLRRQLDEQDAQINKLRSDQLAGLGQEEPIGGREAMDAEPLPDQQSPAGTTEQPASSASTSKSRSGDEMAVFPSDGKTASDSAAQPAPPSALEPSVYFEYDQFSIPDKYDSMLIAHAAYLRAHPDVKAEVQGNCDERGSREYNLALGARRAESVKRALELSGADGSRISAISYGAEKPVASGRDEESYKKNRRVDILYF